jgi:hypothetical protein
VEKRWLSRKTITCLRYHLLPNAIKNRFLTVLGLQGMAQALLYFGKLRAFYP